MSVSGALGPGGRRAWSLARWALAALLVATVSLVPGAAVEAAQGDFTVAVTDDVVTFDPALAEDGISGVVATQIFDTLLTYQGSNLLPAPGLAANWNASADGRTWTFYLRPGVKFHDGTPLTADAVVFNVRRWWDPAHPYHQGGFTYFQALFWGFRGDPNCLLQDVYASGSLTVVLKLSQANSTILSTLAVPFFSIASPAAIQSGTLDTAPVGSGPFRFVERIPGDRVRLEANSNHWRGTPRLQTLVFRVLPGAADRLAGLKNGSIQVSDTVVGSAADPELRVLGRTALNLGYLGINSDHEPLGNLLVRQAIAHAVDKGHYRSAGFSGGAQAADQMLPYGLWGRDPSIVDYDYNPVLARSLLAQAGFTTGITTTLSYRAVPRGYLPNPLAAALTLQNDMEAAGIHLVITEYESGTFLSKVYAGELDLFLLGWGADTPHPDNFFTSHFCPSAGFGPTDDALCDQLAVARATPSVAGQDAIYRWASRRVHETLPLVPLVNVGSGLTTRFDVVGVAPSPMFMESYKDAEVVGAAQSAITPAAGGTLTFDDANDLPTTAQVPPGAVDEPTTFQFVEAEPLSTPVDRGTAHHAFDLSASQDGVPLSGLSLAAPISITIAYSDADLFGIWEEDLALYYWDGTAWQDAASTCSPASTYVHDRTNNLISVGICHLSQFALFGERWPAKYLPLTVR